MSPRQQGPVLVVGGGGDIGQAIVQHFEAQGLAVVSTNRGTLDLSDMTSIQRFLDGFSDAPSGLIFAAATNNPRPFLDSDVDAVVGAIDVNFTSFLRLARVLTARMAEHGGGAVTVISSLYGLIGRAGRLPYAASKHALNGVVQTLAIELGPHGIRVNAVTPGFIDTKLTRKNISPDKLRVLASTIPAGRLGDPDDVAEVVGFLHGPGARYVTGQNIIVDGGFIAGGFMGV